MDSALHFVTSFLAGGLYESETNAAVKLGGSRRSSILRLAALGVAGREFQQGIISGQQDATGVAFRKCKREAIMVGEPCSPFLL